MDWNTLYKTIIDLKFDQSHIIYKEGNVEISLLRPSKNFKNYDINKNFQIFIKEGTREFRPNHLRVLIDLNLRVRSRPDLKNSLLVAFDQIFYKQDPIEAIKPLVDEDFKHSLNSISVISILSQLFILEQDYNYNGESNFDPITLFYQGWVRQFIDNNKEIDNLCMSVCNRQPPLVKYTKQENRKHKAFSDNNDKLWYLPIGKKS